ncbi:uncharacterized protein LOC114731861 [Neltuma alba]|uniref:uncharacterized protein LOC114731861 n=1 Tax=Neltuma alba TaxID=207710 RepID=UPI0010A4765A|nr:uncharacterized protein LOC114731861 [Prosopis alba]
MAAAISLSLPLDPQNLLYPCRLRPNTLSGPLQSRFFTRLSPIYKYPLTTFHREGLCSFKSSSSSSSSHSSTTPTTPTPSHHEDPFRTGRFLSNEELEKLRFLQNFLYFKELESGSLWVRVMGAEEMDMTIGLLAESFAESMVLPVGYVSVLKFLVRQYLMERKIQMPHMATLIGFYKETGEGGEEQEVQLAGTVEVCFNKMGANASPPTPTPPKDSPYISNMAETCNSNNETAHAITHYGDSNIIIAIIKWHHPQGHAFGQSISPHVYDFLFPNVGFQEVERGIGWHLLKAGEELISQMSSSREVYLHCRMIDAAPLNMYKKADYKIVKTDSVLVLLMLQRRKHLMRKKLPLLSNPPESAASESDTETFA